MERSAILSLAAAIITTAILVGLMAREAARQGALPHLPTDYGEASR